MPPIIPKDAVVYKLAEPSARQAMVAKFSPMGQSIATPYTKGKLLFFDMPSDSADVLRNKVRRPFPASLSFLLELAAFTHDAGSRKAMDFSERRRSMFIGLTLEVTCSRSAGGTEGTQSAALGGHVDRWVRHGDYSKANDTQTK